MSETVPGIWFVWERGMSSLSPAIYHDGYPVAKEKGFYQMHRIGKEEAALGVKRLIERYPLIVSTTGDKNV